MDKILVIAPHADDEILGCGATIAKHISRSDQVYVLICTNAFNGAPELFSKEDVSVIRDEAMLAHKILGVKETFFLEFPAPALNAFPEYKISIEISKIIKKINPRILYLPHSGDIHYDHNAIYRSSLVAARPINGCSVQNIYCYETLSETEWAPHQGLNHFIPNHYVDVSDFFQKKIDAFCCFKTQLKKFPHPRSIEALNALASYRGSTVGVYKAEAFEIERQIF